MAEKVLDRNLCQVCLVLHKAHNTPDQLHAELKKNVTQRYKKKCYESVSRGRVRATQNHKGGIGRGVKRKRQNRNEQKQPCGFFFCTIFSLCLIKELL